MRSIEILAQEVQHSRIYRTHTPICDEVFWHVSDMSARIPGIDWSDCCKFPHGPPKKAPYDIEVKHMIHWGQADARIIENAFKIRLPDYVHEFYSKIQECVLNWKYSYQILSPEGVVQWEKFHREEEGAEDLPFHLIRFCKISGSSDSIAFRRNNQTDRWNIDYAGVSDTTEEIQSSEYDSAYLAEDLDEWLQRLMSNDGILHSDDRRLTAVERLA